MFEIAGKIYVVVVVVAIILFGLTAFMLYLERRIGKAERKLDEIEQQAARTKGEGEKA
jgi:uncharacterized iron-regulated membrane protein